MTMPAPQSVRGLPMWVGLAEELRKHPGETILIEAFTDTPRLRSLMTIINQQLNPTLKTLGGRVRAHMRNSYRDGVGVRRGDLWVVWHPEE